MLEIILYDMAARMSQTPTDIVIAARMGTSVVAFAMEPREIEAYAKAAAAVFTPAEPDCQALEKLLNRNGLSCGDGARGILSHIVKTSRDWERIRTSGIRIVLVDKTVDNNPTITALPLPTPYQSSDPCTTLPARSVA